ncbi:MAG TPA: glycoside hydrolase family 36 N-terminal domain-containing protein, partial [Phototrophicaceae bacterium]|nr:glycoside hydrolase family 36 N-terminal domain-containing protein [Phototrophicaceae bacterium]
MVESFFAVSIDGQRFDQTNMALQSFTDDKTTFGGRHQIGFYSSPQFELEIHLMIDGSLVYEFWQVIRSTSGHPLQITRFDSLILELAVADPELLYFTSDWGREFEPVRVPLSGEIILENRAGRSSKGLHPWAAIFQSPDYVTVV